MKEWIFSEKGTRWQYLLSSLLFNIVKEVLGAATKQYKKMKSTYNEIKKKLSLSVITQLCNLKESTKILELNT